MAASLFLRVVAVSLILFSTIIYAYSTTVAVTRQTVQALEGYVVDVYWWQVPPTPNRGPNPNLQCSPQPGTLSETYPTSDGFYSLGPGQVACVASPAYTSTQTFSGGPCLLVVFMADPPNPPPPPPPHQRATVGFSLSVSPSGQLIGSGYFTVSGSSITEYNTSFTCKPFTVQASQYINLTLYHVSGPPVTVYFGKTYPTDVQLIRSVDSA